MTRHNEESRRWNDIHANRTDKNTLDATCGAHAGLVLVIIGRFPWHGGIKKT